MKKVEWNKYRRKVNINDKAFAFYLYNCPEEPVSTFVNALDDCLFNEEYRRIDKPEKEYYHYHPDHLGSSSWITDQRGTPVQHIQYLPFGETWADQRSANWNAPYTFSGKEKDWETSYHYYGARYYDSDLSIWLSVDPLASKYPGWSPYNYCFQNPIRLIDPDGRAPWEPTNVKQARRYAKATGGTLRIDKMNDGKWASVANASSEGLEIKAFKPTNDSWGQKIGNFFRKIGNAMTGGIFGTADNGQSQEIRKGDGSNKSVDLSSFTSNMPEPFDKKSGNLNTGENAHENKEGTSGTFYVKEETGSWNGGPSSWEYNGREDSAKKIEQFENWEKELNTKYIIKVEVNE